jgi:glycosyltransferase involved in cell wall biosynthesis
MKILYAMTHTLKGKEGGASYSMDTLIKEMSKKHDCVPFVCPQKIEPYGLFPMAHQRAKINIAYAIRFLDELIEDESPDIIHTSGFGSSLFGLHVKQRHRIPWVHHHRSPSEARFFSRVLEQADHLILIGRYMNRFQLPSVPKSLIHNPISFLVKPSFSPAMENGILMVSGTDYRKGTHIGIRAWKRSKIPLPLHIYGRTYKRARREIEKNNGVIHHDIVTNQELHEAMRKAYLTLFPITVQGYGVNRAILESQSVGTLTLTSGGFDGFDDPPILNSLTFSPKVRNIEDAIQRARVMASDEYEERTRRAYDWVRENCTARNCANKVEEVYEAVA